MHALIKLQRTALQIEVI